MKLTKLTENELGVVILALSALFGMLYPHTARWILLVLCLCGLWSWWKQTGKEEEEE